MKNLLRCKVCGYVMAQGKLGDKCPACGVPASNLEPYKPRVSKKRWYLMNLDLHPVMVHLPQSFSATILVLGILTLFAGDSLRSRLEAALWVLGICLPFVVAGALGSGLIDGKIRFKRLNTSVLNKKKLLSFAYFVLAVILAVSILILDFDRSVLVELVISIAFLCLVCGFFLGRLGASLRCARFPG
jgi:uncharacterized membrane protein